MTIISELCIHDLAHDRTRVVLRHQGRIEAPNIAPCGSWALVNGGGQLFRVDLAQPELVALDMGGVTKANNDHGFSPDGRTIYFSAHHRGQGAEIYRMSANGGSVERLDLAPRSWWHGISPDGDAIVYPAARGDLRSIDIHLWRDGQETRLTEDMGHCDGPDFSHDGQQIYFNSDATGTAQIWVMNTDGGAKRQVFSDARVNWFPHPSPCGRWVVYLSYPPGTQGHPADLAVELWLMTPDGRQRRPLLPLRGGQGSLNVPPWSADGESFAFMRFAG